MAGVTNGASHRPAVSRVLVLGYHDGATDGIILFADAGPTFRFELADGADVLPGATTRRYTLRPLPAGSLDRLVVALAPLGPAAWPVWCPIWRFPSEEVRGQVEAVVDEVLAAAGPPAAELTTADPFRFDTVRVDRTAAIPHP